jgi:hypothetical protein
MNSISFHRIIALLSSVWGQLCYLSLKLQGITSIVDPVMISGDTIQQLCIDRLQPTAVYILNLLLYIRDDCEEKLIFNSFFKVPFIHRQRPRVFIQELNERDIGPRYHCFTVYTVPYNNTTLSSHMFSTDLVKYVENICNKKSFFFLFRSCQMPIDPVKLFPRADTLFLQGHRRINCVRDLGNYRSSISSLVPWSLLTKISINYSNVLTSTTLESILRMAYNVHTLDLFDDRGILLWSILNNHNLISLMNQQVRISNNLREIFQ